MRTKALTSEQKVDERVKTTTKKLKTALLEAGITQQDVAAAAGITQASVANQFRRGQLTYRVYTAITVLLEEQ